PNLVLPPIKLESFDGNDITRWPAYKYQPDSLILNEPSLNEVQKAFHVRSTLKGTALSLVSTIPTNQGFLSKILERLESEYNRHNLTQATLLQSLLQIRSKSTRLDDQLTTVRSMINLVYTINDDCGLDGLLTQQQMADRVHSRFISVIWEQKPPTLLKALMLIEDTLRKELEKVTITDAIADRSHRQQNSIVVYNNSGGKSNKPKHSVEDRSSFSPKQSKEPTCVFCGKHPLSYKCTAVTSPKDRREKLRGKAVCHCCFSTAHTTNECKRKCPNCSGQHHWALCDKPKSTSVNVNKEGTHQSHRLFTASAIITNPNLDAHRASMAYIHFDHGSQATLITRDLVNRLALVPIEQRKMSIRGLHDKHTRPSFHDIVKIDIVTDRGKYSVEAVVHEGSSVNSISTHPLDDNDLSVVQSTIGTVPNRFSNFVSVETDLLLSVTDTMELLENSKETKLPSGCRLFESPIGPIVVGSSRAGSRSFKPSVSALTVNTEPSFEQKLERLFSVDPSARVYGTTEKESRKVTDELVNKHFEDTIQKQGEEYFVQYSVKPLAKDDLPSNYDLATSRLNSTVRTLSKDRTYLELYDSVIQDQLSLGQIELVDPSDAEGIIHYLAHQPVLRPDKPSTPLRIVYDASAHLKNSPSLNDMIYPGPGDLEIPNILVFRFCVTPFGVNQSPILLNKVINHHIQLHGKDLDPTLIQQLVTNLYVDNVIINVDRPLSIMYTQSKQIFESMSMNLRDYASNDPDFISTIPESDQSSDNVQKLLGLLWNNDTDQLFIKIPISSKDGEESKRSMLSKAASPFDPLGFLNPLLIPLRLDPESLEH
ncbi:hypothetical protein PENTCL1PPCAC_10560, partial [Pristionchus entomophagus]